MIGTGAKINRRMLPRWRSLQQTLLANELSAKSSSAKGATSDILTQEMLKHLERWSSDRNVKTAAEVVNAAIVLGQESVGVEAAHHLLDHSSRAMPLLRKQAEYLLSRLGFTISTPVTSDPPVSAWRKRTRLNPHDAIAWVELALHQVQTGNARNARKPITVALRLAPNNRHVLRSAARFFHYLGDPEQAHDLVSRSPATKDDPWLLSAEISLSFYAGRAPRFLKHGLRVLGDDGLAPHQITELAGALATNELIDGSRKKARKLFEASLAEPTGNSLAQAEWASPHFGFELYSPDQINQTLEANEAQALYLYKIGQFTDIPDICLRWASEEPTSIIPYDFGASAAGLIESHNQAIDLSERGLRLNQRRPLLLNCLAYSLASLGRLDEASKALNEISSFPEVSNIQAVTLANRGLIAFRNAQIEVGTGLYREAFAVFDQIGLPEQKAFANLFYVREAVLAELPEAASLLRDALVQAKSISRPDHRYVCKQLVSVAENKNLLPHVGHR